MPCLWGIWGIFFGLNRLIRPVRPCDAGFGGDIGPCLLLLVLGIVGSLGIIGRGMLFRLNGLNRPIRRGDVVCSVFERCLGGVCAVFARGFFRADHTHYETDGVEL